MDYVCKESNKCVIDVSRRNQCQACRLKKCLEMKMNKDGKYWSILSRRKNSDRDKQTHMMMMMRENKLN